MEFVVYGPHYDENSGGTIALFKLADILNKLGHQCTYWTWDRIGEGEIQFKNGKFCTQFTLPENISKEIGTNPFKIDPAKPEECKNSIVIYPEIIEGNPLGAKRVVRWLLNKPGEITGKVAYGISELFVFYQRHFVPDTWTISESRHLYLRHFPTSIYYQKNFGPRIGTCHLVRKGKDRKLDYHPAESICIDGLPHSTVAEIFNTCKEFISYDLHSAYSMFAALCGCDSIVVPEENLSAASWKSGDAEHESYGIAYGRNDLERAQRTKPYLVDSLKGIEEHNLGNVRRFVETCKSFDFNSQIDLNR